MADAIKVAEQSSVRDETYKKDELYAPVGNGIWFIAPIQESDVLAPWGTYRRDLDLRRYARHLHNTLFMGAVNNLGSEIASTPWQLYGKRNQKAYHDLLMNAEFGAGWRVFAKKVVSAFCTYDSGVPIELVSRGNPDAPLAGKVEAINTLDPVYAELTGNIDYPIIYRSMKGGYHRMHRTRVWRIVDNPQVDRDFFGRGLSALSRYFSIAWMQILMNRYNVEKLSDLPPAGIAFLNNIKGTFEDVLAAYEAQRRRDGQGVWRNIMRFDNYDPNTKASIDFTSFSQLPDQFNYDMYMRHHINIVALALGVDPQDVAPLSGQALGTGAQSFVLDSKAQRKTPGLLLAEIETFINTCVLPAYLEFKFTPHDTEGEKAEAETAQLWVNVANSAPLTDEQKLTLLANKVGAIADVVTDKQGNIIWIDSDNPDATGEDTGTDAPLDDSTTPGTDSTEAEPLDDTDDNMLDIPSKPKPAIKPAQSKPVDTTQAGSFKYNSAGIAIPQGEIFGYHIDAGIVDKNEVRATLVLPPQEGEQVGVLQDLQSRASVMQSLVNAGIPTAIAAQMVELPVPEGTFDTIPTSLVQTAQPDEKDYRKAYSSTRADFESYLSGLIDGMVRGDITRIKGKLMMFDRLKADGYQAMVDGLADGGVDVSRLEGDDKSTFDDWYVEQSNYAVEFIDSIFKDGVAPDGSSRAQVWANKSLNSIYQKGLLSADANGFYEWVLGATIDHCKTCSGFAGDVHRLKWWHDNGCLPQGSCLECHGYKCDCKLKRKRGTKMLTIVRYFREVLCRTA